MSFPVVRALGAVPSCGSVRLCAKPGHARKRKICDLESDRVVILLPNKLPLSWKGQKPWQFQQEMNLKYVALTRAKKELVFVDVELKDLLKVDFNNK